ncbi:hypothetical protein A2U01_0081310, partial [Trifolium medium]|nr:hypothetical protein [Trifolium medium]
MGYVKGPFGLCFMRGIGREEQNQEPGFEKRKKNTSKRKREELEIDHQS